MVVAGMAAVVMAAVVIAAVLEVFTVAVSTAAARRFMAAAFVMADTDSRMANAFTGITSTGVFTTRRPTIITRTATAGWCGRITDRARSAAIARGTITGATITAGIIAITVIDKQRSEG